MVYSEEYYAKRKADQCQDDAKQIGVVINELYNSNSVIDSGCAIGQRPKRFHVKT